METILLLLLCLLSGKVRSDDLPLTPEQKQILSEVSWNIKLLLLKEFLHSNQHRQKSRRVGEGYDMAPPRRSLLQLEELKGHDLQQRSRRVGMEAFVMGSQKRRQDGGEAPSPNEDTDMKMKLFRLMYETVRDSDLKVKRAELINSYYLNSTSFEIGYLIGDITDKFSVMTDIADTLKRLYDTWKPLEHINAYEQIANQAIETSHLIELVRSVSKRAETHPEQTTHHNKKH